ncbi:class I SAM-dependent methyltransferase [Zunongwangia sp. HRR-M8]|uniref:class I SAM-dependent methyltransferase n=1 Tax=Zunongwangia sp. HRR-M8 TaxID=3015170 RepID=UPI0022DD9728|nr:class I SAM-dependent methyltransferase [Zunongwangia sp. HRR-M8]WBL22382.1 class I SAM-dependent methyltransferase [Zunongwangia sp. HRR-M8]
MKQPDFYCKDYLVSGEEYHLEKWKHYDILKTSPVPENLSTYYQSEDYISHTDASKSFTDKLYNMVKSYMLQKKVGWIIKQKKEGKLLDIGAGTGDFLNAASRYFEVDGVEPNAIAIKNAALKNLELKNDLVEISDQYDIITMWHVLEHVPNLEHQFKEFNRLLKDDGILVIAVPNFKSKDAEIYKKFWAAYDVPRHLWHFSKSGIQKLFFENGYDLIHSNGLIFDSFYVSLLSEKHKTGKQNLISAFFNGLKSNLSAASTGEYSSMVYFFKKY